VLCACATYQAMPQPNEDPTELDPQDLNVDVKRWGGEY
jgi:hypothetical protein